MMSNKLRKMTINADLRENHCGSCVKVFCCSKCRAKHELLVHNKTEPDTVKKVVAPNRNTSSRRKNSLPKIPETAKPGNNGNLKNIKRKDLKNFYNDNSNLTVNENEMKSGNKDKKRSSQTKDAPTEVKITNGLSTDEKKSQQTKEASRQAFSEKNLNVTVTVEEDTDSSANSEYMNISESSAGDENTLPKEIVISESQNFNSTAGNTPPRNQALGGDQSITNENSSVYRACLDRWETDSELSDTKSDVSDSLPIIEISGSTKNEEELEKSSIYFACSEYFSEGSSGEKLAGSNDVETFDEFEKDPKLASTKLETTISFNAETYYEAQGNSSTSTLSPYSKSSSMPSDDCCPINQEKLQKAPEKSVEIMKTGTKAGTTQNCDVTSTNPLGGSCGVAEESGEKNNEQDTILNNAESSSAAKGDSSFWQSFSNSINRVYNSTKEMCSGLGRKNRSKRELDDTEELQPKPKRQKILCRPPIRENPKIIFRQDGDVRRPVIAFDKGTQTDFLF